MGLRDIFNDEDMPQQPNLLQDGTINEDGEEEGSQQQQEGGDEDFGRNDAMDNDDGNQGSFPGAAYVDRFLRVRGVPKVRNENDPGFLADPDFMEQFMLASMNKSEQNKFYRNFWRIQMISEADGGAEEVRTRAQRYAIRLIMQRGRNDTPNELTERAAFIEHRSRSTATNKLINGGNGGAKASSFLSRLFGK